MARGSANNEPIVSQANTEGFRDGYERTFGERKPQRGSWVWDREAGRLVPADEYSPAPEARHAPVMVDRYMEGVRANDGTDIGSRAKRREYMRRTGLADASDFSPKWYADVQSGRKREHRKRLRETLARRMYEIDKP